MKKKNVSEEFSTAALLSTLLVVGFAVAIPQLHMLNEIAFGYYRSLPVAEQYNDFDRDGIPNHIDDSDGDTISDKYDPSPFGTLHGAAQ